MNLAITDACIFIDLYHVQLTDSFFKLNYEIHTSYEVMDELHDHQKELLQAYHSTGKLTVHEMQEEDWHQIQDLKLPKSLTPNDKTVLYLASKNQCMVLSSDKKVRQQAKKLCCEYHGLFWILDQLIESQLITKKEAILKLEMLFQKNRFYPQNREMVEEKEKRMERWK